ncbi:MAG: diguanylate cyclase [Pseudodesulfovibrio sp.]
MSYSSNSCAIVEDSRSIIVLESDESFSKAISMSIWAETDISPCVVSSVAEAVGYIEENADIIDIAVVGLEVEGAGELLETLARERVPCIAYGADFDDAARKHLSTLSVADVVLGARAVLADSVGHAVGRIVSNRDVDILVVDDSKSMRLALVRFLTTRCYNVFEACDGVDALGVLGKYPTIKLVITDNEMPNMDGFSLIKEIRKTHSKDDLAVIGISGKTNSLLSVKFINNGANDFLNKPFRKEELYCRVDHNVEMLDRIRLIRDLSNKDPMTRLYNRRYFFNHCDDFVEQAEAEDKTLITAMIDIDFFKNFNDTYGHDVGDEVIIKVANLISEAFPEDAIVSRFGGEEFCVLSAHEAGDDPFARYDMLRRSIEAAPIDVDGDSVVVTVSIGVTKEKAPIPLMIKKADELLYDAKESGRNRVSLS